MYIHVYLCVRACVVYNRTTRYGKAWHPFLSVNSFSNFYFFSSLLFSSLLFTSPLLSPLLLSSLLFSSLLFSSLPPSSLLLHPHYFPSRPLTISSISFHFPIVLVSSSPFLSPFLLLSFSLSSILFFLHFFFFFFQAKLWIINLLVSTFRNFLRNAFLFLVWNAAVHHIDLSLTQGCVSGRVRIRRLSSATKILMLFM